MPRSLGSDMARNGTAVIQRAPISTSKCPLPRGAPVPHGTPFNSTSLSSIDRSWVSLIPFWLKHHLFFLFPCSPLTPALYCSAIYRWRHRQTQTTMITRCVRRLHAMLSSRMRILWLTASQAYDRNPKIHRWVLLLFGNAETREDWDRDWPRLHIIAML